MIHFGEPFVVAKNFEVKRAGDTLPLVVVGPLGISAKLYRSSRSFRLTCSEASIPPHSICPAVVSPKCVPNLKVVCVATS